MQGVPEISNRDHLLAGLAQRMLDERRMRTRQFDPVLFGEPGWDMLLKLFARQAADLRTTAAELRAASAVPATTAARWLEVLHQQGLVGSHNHPLDLSTQFVHLTDPATDALDRYLLSCS
jgi:DNA-binding MarR family transcriptional regulator